MTSFWKHICCCFGYDDEYEKVPAQETEPLQQRVTALQRENLEFRKELGDLKQQLSTIRSAGYGTLTSELSSTSPSSSALATSSKAHEAYQDRIVHARFAQFINNVTIAQGNGDAVTRTELLQFKRELVTGLDGFAQSLRHELREELRAKLTRSVELSNQQKKAIFEILFDYTFDTNLQQCHDSALLTASTDHLDSPARRSLEERLKKQAIEDAAKRMDSANPFLEASSDELLLGSEPHVESSTSLIAPNSTSLGLLGAASLDHDE